MVAVRFVEFFNLVTQNYLLSLCEDTGLCVSNTLMFLMIILANDKVSIRSEMSFFGVSHRIVAVHEMSLTCRRRRQDARVIFF